MKSLIALLIEIGSSWKVESIQNKKMETIIVQASNRHRKSNPYTATEGQYKLQQ